MAEGALERARFDAVLFDLDGVLADTARLHARCWREVLDELLSRRFPGAAPIAEADYRLYLDGRPRLDGVRAFLRGRRLALPEGAPGDSPEADTVHGVAARKDRCVVRALEAGRVAAFPDARPCLRGLLRHRFAIAVVSASRHARAVLAACALAALVDVVVDGNDAEARRLAGKPAPDTYLEAARLFGAVPARAVVVEDALAGIEAGRRGGFGWVVGVAREGDGTALRGAGADRVIRDLGELLP